MSSSAQVCPETVLRSRSRHSVQLYRDDAFLLEDLTRIVGSSLGAGNAAIVVATDEHIALLIASLEKKGIDVAAVTSQSRLVALDAGESLSRFMVDGMPDAVLFRQFVEGLIVSVLGNSSPNSKTEIVVFGEMVALLWGEKNRAAAIKLEKLWNELGQLYMFELHCAYPLHLFPESSDFAEFSAVCNEHSHVIPTERFGLSSSNDDKLRTIAHLEQQAHALQTEIIRREALQRDLEEREAELRDYLENAIVGMHWVSGAGEIVWANKAELALLGYERDEYIGRHISEFHADETAIEDILCRLSRFEELRGYETKMRCKDGSIRHVRIDSNVFARNGEFRHTRCFTTDITEQKATEAIIAHMAAIVESSDDAIISKSLNGIVKSWNKGAERILGYAAEEIIGRPITTIIPPEFIQDETMILAKIRAGERINHFETVRLHKDGHPIDVSLTISPIRNKAGEIVGAAKILRNITEQKNLEAALHLTERLAAVGRLAATVSHEINNPLESVTNLIYLASERPEASDSIREYLHLAQEELNRAVHISRQTLGFYRATSASAWLEVDRIIDSVLGIYERKFAYKNLTILRDFEPGLKIYMESGELKQVLSNLISNAFEACEQNAGMTIRAHTARHARPGEPEIRFTIADTGIGIPKESQSKLFTPFFTTKELLGNGLGLWITKSIVEKRGGRVQVRSRATAPSGTVMSFYLPQAKSYTNGMKQAC